MVVCENITCFLAFGAFKVGGQQTKREAFHFSLQKKITSQKKKFLYAHEKGMIIKK